LPGRHANKEDSVAGCAIRFLQASDFQLDRPLSSLGQVPAGLRESLQEASYDATRRVFDTAVAERVDFMLLPGNLCDPRHVGARGLVFLVEQFRRLEEQGIPIFWSHGHDDRANRWPAGLKWPGNVKRFTQAVPQVEHFTRDGLATVDIVGSSWTRRTNEPGPLFTSDGTTQFTIAMLGGNISAGATEGMGPHYWAMGGANNAATHDVGHSIVHWSGTPQGRGPAEAGSHGCSVVEVDDHGGFNIRHVSCDAVRWLDDEIAVDEGCDSAGIEQLVMERSKELSLLNPDRIMAVTWELGTVPVTALGHRLRSPAAEWKATLIERLEVARENLVVAGIHWNSPFNELAFEEDSLRGSFLRSLARLLDEKQVTNLLAQALPDETSDPLAKILSSDDAATIAMVVDEVAALGDSLLDGAARSRPLNSDKPEAA
jgi:exonuclease SbcD